MLKRTTLGKPSARMLAALICAAASLGAATPALAAPAAQGLVKVYRLYNATLDDHVWTVRDEEYEKVRNEDGWVGEDVKWLAPASGETPVFRLYNIQSNKHLFTADAHERDVLLAEDGWIEEDSGIFSADASEGKPLYRLYNPVTQAHLLTSDENERNVLSTARGWSVDDVSVYAAALPGEVAEPEEPVVPEEPSAPEEPGLSEPNGPGDAIDPNDPEAALRERILDFAMGYVGWPYVYAGESPEEGGFDCSGLVQYVYANFGVDLPRTTYDLERYIKERGTWTTDIEDLEIGDVIVMNHSGHVGIFAGKDPETGRYMMVDAGNYSTGVVYREIFYYYHPEWSGPLQGGGSVL